MGQLETRGAQHKATAASWGRDGAAQCGVSLGAARAGPMPQPALQRPSVTAPSPHVQELEKSWHCLCHVRHGGKLHKAQVVSGKRAEAVSHLPVFASEGPAHEGAV